MATGVLYGNGIFRLKEIAAKAMACGYLYREGDIFFTKFLVTREEDRERLFDITGRLCSAMPKEIADGVAGSGGSIKKEVRC